MTVTAESLRAKLDNAIDLLIEGKITSADATAVSSLANQMIESAKAEANAARIYSEIGDTRIKRTPFLIGNDNA